MDTVFVKSFLALPGYAESKVIFSSLIISVSNFKTVLYEYVLLYCNTGRHIDQIHIISFTPWYFSIYHIKKTKEFDDHL